MSNNARRRDSSPSSSSTGQCNDDAHERQSEMVEMGSHQQKLLWPPSKEGETGVTQRVDIVQATRLSDTSFDLPVGCGVCFIESGIRFDPEEFPDNSRDTQEKLATKLIESGISAVLGKTIKVKEYSSKARKRIRFACSREECSVTFQVNFDSKKGHWFMKRHKGTFEHSCAAVKSVVQSDSPCWESCALAATMKKFDQPLKRCSPGLSHEGATISPKKSRTRAHREQPQPLQNSERQRTDENMWSPHLGQQHLEDRNSSRAETPTIRNGNASPKRMRTVEHVSYAQPSFGYSGSEPMWYRGYAASPLPGHSHNEHNTLTQVHPRSSVAIEVSLYSQDSSYKGNRDRNDTNVHPMADPGFAQDRFPARVSVSSATNFCEIYP